MSMSEGSLVRRVAHAIKTTRDVVSGFVLLLLDAGRIEAITERRELINDCRALGAPDDALDQARTFEDLVRLKDAYRFGVA